MKELVKCIIMSHKRADRVETIKAVANISICVPESQAKDYEKHNRKIEIIVHPDTVIGLSAKFRWMFKKYKNVALLDDDIYGVKRMWTTTKDDLPANLEPDVAYEVIQTTAQVAKDIGVKMFGFGKEPHPVAYSGHEPFGVSGFVPGGMVGFLEGWKMEIPDECIAAADFYLSCINAYYFRKMFIDKRYFTACKEGTFKSTGGMSDFRTIETEKADLMLLRESFGQVIVMKKPNPLRKLQHQYEHTLNLPF